MEPESINNIKVTLHDEFEQTGKQIGDELFIPFSLLEKGSNLEKQWNEKARTLRLKLTHANVLEISHYDYKGKYLHYDRNKVENWNVTFTHHGIPKVIYPHGTYFNPSTIAQYGLQHYSLYLNTKDLSNKYKFLKTADWFLDQQDSLGGWAYQFDHDFFPGRLNKLQAPWYSAIGQGMAMSVLSRAYHLTQNKKYNYCSLKAKTLFKTPSAKNGILTKFESNYLFYEECPTDSSSYILNGFMFSLIGLYDLFKTTGNNETKWLYDRGIVTLKRMLPLYDLGYRTAYDLTHYTTDGGYPNVASWGYHIGHTHLLAALNSIEKDPKLNETLNRWKGYLKGKTI